ncbi:MAG: L28 family ribosomal protein [Patescibacteria group bacterium]
MSKICQKCDRGPQSSQSRSHSNVATKRWLGINVQVKTIKGKRLLLCTRCIRSLGKKTTTA